MGLIIKSYLVTFNQRVVGSIPTAPTTHPDIVGCFPVSGYRRRHGGHSADWPSRFRLCWIVKAESVAFTPVVSARAKSRFPATATH